MDINKNYNFSDNKQQISTLISIGERLRRAREAIGLSQENIADCLCLKLSIIKNIEDGCCNMHTLKIASIFLYGYIRSYARLVHINDIETVFSNHQIDEISCSVNINKKFRVLDFYRQYRTRIILCSICCLLCLFFIFIVMAWYLQSCFLKVDYCGVINLRSIRSCMICKYQRPFLTQQFRVFMVDKNCYALFIESLYYIDNITSPLLYFFCNSDDIDYLSFGVESCDTRHNIMNDINNIICTMYKHVLVLSFTSECWVEVIDASDKILYVGTKYSGDVLNLVGRIPYRLVIGSPRSVSIRYQGDLVDADKFIHPHRVMRLTIPM